MEAQLAWRSYHGLSIIHSACSSCGALPEKGGLAYAYGYRNPAWQHRGAHQGTERRCGMCRARAEGGTP